MPRQKATDAKALERALSAQEYIESVLAADPWIAQGLATLLTDKQLDNYLLKQCNATTNEFISNSDTNRREEILQHIKNYFIKKQYAPTGNKGVIKIVENGTEKEVEYDKHDWKLPMKFFMRIAVPVGQIDKVQDKIKLSFSKEPDYCDICSTKEQVTESKMYIYPFAVTLDKFANFYSNMSRSFKLCRRCVASSFAAFDSCIYHRQEDRVHLFFFEAELETLKQIVDKLIRPAQDDVQDKKRCNFYFKFYGTEPFETLFSLLLTLFDEKSNYDFENQPLVIHIVSATHAGNVFSINERDEFRDFTYMYKLYNTFIEALYEKGIESPLHQILYEFVFREKDKYNTTYREKICKAIIKKRDVLDVVEKFLYEVLVDQKKNLSLAAMSIIETYIKYITSLDGETLDLIKRYAFRIGGEAYKQDKLNFLYRLKNCKNKEQLLNTLNLGQFILKQDVDLKILEEIMVENSAKWDMIKRLLSIYSVNYYLLQIRMSKKDKAQEGQADSGIRH